MMAAIVIVGSAVISFIALLGGVAYFGRELIRELAWRSRKRRIVKDAVRTFSTEMLKEQAQVQYGNEFMLIYDYKLHVWQAAFNIPQGGSTSALPSAAKYIHGAVDQLLPHKEAVNDVAAALICNLLNSQLPYGPVENGRM